MGAVVNEAADDATDLGGEGRERERERDFPISPIDEVGRALARFHNAVNSRLGHSEY